MPRGRASLHDVGTWLVLLVVVGVAGVVVLSYAMNAAADDLRQEVSMVSGAPLDHERTAVGTLLSDRLSADIARSDLAGLRARADELDHRADRIREAAGVAALLGLVVMLVTARPETRSGEARDASSPLANTSSNGSV
jgi:Arc/MetJ family transcription regulator